MAAKEIWYVWDGHHEKPTNVVGVLYSDGSLLDSKGRDLSWLSSYMYKSDWNYIVAYTLGETRERVECEGCKGCGFVQNHLCVLEFLFEHKKCLKCQGRGYVWKMGVEA